METRMPWWKPEYTTTPFDDVSITRVEKLREARLRWYGYVLRVNLALFERVDFSSKCPGSASKEIKAALA
ncbi:unnamed protein product [Heligmosomoides polygyrus]|uniref:Transposase n=1 Tax=Heligmosomoides polygyrus TaxID=6339 RepID=A0A183GG77_HELPZ|nr:unnamed protein product [Heligmosomoides polygyrus]